MREVNGERAIVKRETANGNNKGYPYLGSLYCDQSI